MGLLLDPFRVDELVEAEASFHIHYQAFVQVLKVLQADVASLSGDYLEPERLDVGLSVAALEGVARGDAEAALALAVIGAEAGVSDEAAENDFVDLFHRENGF